MRIAIYARVSTDDKGQTPENQLRELREWCARAGHEIVTEYVDYESGRKAARLRPKLDALLQDAGKRKFDLVLVWALDRFSREGMAATVGYLQRLASFGVSFHSYTEPLISTDNELVRDVVIAILASLAKAEAQKIAARVKAGMARARAAGKHLGRPGKDPERVAKARQLLSDGVGICRAAKLSGLGVGTCAEIKAELAA